MPYYGGQRHAVQMQSTLWDRDPGPWFTVSIHAGPDAENNLARAQKEAEIFHSLGHDARVVPYDDLPLDPEPYVWVDHGPLAPRAKTADAHDAVHGYVTFAPRTGYEQDRARYEEAH